MPVKYIVAVDVGTSNIKCHVYDERAAVIGASCKPTELLYPKPGWVEMDYVFLWNTFLTVVRNAIEEARISPSQIACMGITAFRATFITWDKVTGEPFHNFISWNDLRADHLVKSWDSSFSMRGLRLGAKMLYKITGEKRYLAASVLRLANRQVNMRLLWALENVPNLRSRASDGKVLFGTIGTWLLWKLTEGAEHATDYSFASTTALYDPFLMEWAAWAFRLFNIPIGMMPVVKDTSGYFGECSSKYFGASFPITAMAGDQQAAMFGQCCFELGDVKCTMGTGSFLDINTGDKPHASVGGLYPLIGWKYGNKTVYLAEGISNDTGNVITWAQSIANLAQKHAAPLTKSSISMKKKGLLENPSDSSQLALNAFDSGGVCFIPGFSGLQAPFNDDNACAGLIGLSPCSSKSEIVRAILESLAYRVKQLYDVFEKEATYKLNFIRVDGGVSKNNFVMQLISDLTGKAIDRPRHIDMSCLGIAFLAGLAAGIWKSEEELKTFRKPENVFKSQVMTDSQKKSAREWKRAVERCLNWRIG